VLMSMSPGGNEGTAGRREPDAMRALARSGS
jgi:hypothetical protein